MLKLTLELVGGICTAAALLLASPGITAPVLDGPPPRSVTSPGSVTSTRLVGVTPASLNDLFSLRDGHDATWSHNGRGVVASINLTGRYNLWTFPADGGFPLQLTQSDDRQLGIAVTSSEMAIFQSDHAGGEIYDVFMAPLTGGLTINLTNSPTVSETRATLSRDGRRLAFERRVQGSSSTDIAILDPITRAVRLLTHETDPGRTWSLAGLTADGRSVIATRSDFNRTMGEVYAIDTDTSEAVSLTRNDDAFVTATGVSPNGRKVALTIDDAGRTTRAAVLDVPTHHIVFAKPDVWEQRSGDISPDGREMVFSSNVDGQTSLYIYNLVTTRSRLVPIPLGFNAQGSSNGGSFSPDSKRLLVTHQTAAASFDFWVVNLAAGKASPVTRLGLASIAPDRLPKSQVVHYLSKDRTVISAMLWMPFNLMRNGKNAAVVLAHGGPTDQLVDRFNRTAVALASRGYLVIAPNPRGSTGYGRAFEIANRKDLGGGDLDDEVAGARFLVATGYVDPGRIGITGSSYGGFMTLMAIAKTPAMWAAAVEQYGIIDWGAVYRTAAPTLRQYLRGLIGDPDHDAAVYTAASPLTFINQVRAPLLILQGRNDIRVPSSQADTVASLLKADGRTVEAHYYADEGHGFLKRENLLDALTRTVDWFERYLAPRQAQ